MNPKQQAYKFIKKCLLAERIMRVRVLSGEHKERKVQEIDDALKALDVLAADVKLEPEAVQAGLFGIEAA